jgi:glycosyltransferase involved in cell wall biosynthesis
MCPTIYIDLRCLQDYNYRVRGIGQHLTALLRTRSRSALSSVKTIGLIQTQAPSLPAECSSLVDEVTASLNPSFTGSPVVFIDGTPMSHDTRFSLRFVGNPNVLTAAVVYDFIPLDWPGYLPFVANRMDYLAKMARLRKFDLFMPISEYSAWRLGNLLGVPADRTHVTGASVRNAIYQLKEGLDRSTAANSERPYFMLVVGPDRRKNPEVAISAVRRLNLLYSRNIALKIAGHFEASSKESLLQLAGHSEREGFLEFYSDVSDAELVGMYAGALATIVPSHIEGFSLPIVEAAVCGSPVIASTCAAHLELVDNPAALFPSYDDKTLTDRLEALLIKDGLRAELIASQAHLPVAFHEDSVGNRFWTALGSALQARKTKHSGRRRRPRLAVLSPFPPDQSGVARYTAMALNAGERLFDSDLYTDAARPLTVEGRFRDAGRVTRAPFTNSAYDGIVSVIGNSLYHNGVFEVFEKYGGPCILHDARLTGIYFRRMGPEGFLRFAEGLLGRAVSMEEAHLWLQDRNLPTLFLERIVERAKPLIVHTVTQKALLKARYGVDAQVATCCPTIFFDSEELSIAARQAAREKLGISQHQLVISTFGIVDKVKGTETCVAATEILRSWNIPAELYLVGGAGPHKTRLDDMAESYGIAPYFHCCEDFVDDATYKAFLIASDAAIQLRTYGYGQLSAALTDCISAELSCVANQDLALSCDAPAYVRTVPDCFSPLQVAEQLASIFESPNDGKWKTDSRSTYLETHNFQHYARRLAEILELA